MKLKRLQPAVFEQAAARTRLGEQARAMARAVLVDGRAQTHVAAEHGMTRQRVGLAVAAVERAATRGPGEAPVSIVVELPASLAREVDVFAATLARSTDVTAHAGAVEKVRAAMRAARRQLMPEPQQER